MAQDSSDARHRTGWRDVSTTRHYIKVGCGRGESSAAASVRSLLNIDKHGKIGETSEDHSRHSCLQHGPDLKSPDCPHAGGARQEGHQTQQNSGYAPRYDPSNAIDCSRLAPFGNGRKHSVHGDGSQFQNQESVISCATRHSVHELAAHEKLPDQERQSDKTTCAPGTGLVTPAPENKTPPCGRGQRVKKVVLGVFAPATDAESHKTQAKERECAGLGDLRQRGDLDFVDPIVGIEARVPRMLISRGAPSEDAGHLAPDPSTIFSMSATLSSPRQLIIATRESALAMWQAEHVRDRLRAHHPSCDVTLLGVTTQGDRIVDRPLADIGGKGLFIKELEQAMADGRADLAVHSLKDVPMDMPPGFVLAAIMKREDPRDAWVSNRFQSMTGLPARTVVGTSSLRREAQLRERYPALDVKPLRGNVNTRLKKLDDGQYAAIILAAAGLTRLGFADRIAALLDPDDSLPAIGQGALAVECHADRADVVAALAPLADIATTLATGAERAFGQRLGGSCHTPLAALGEWLGDQLRLRGLIASRDGLRVLRGERTGAVANVEAAKALGDALGAEFLARGAAAILASEA